MRQRGQPVHNSAQTDEHDEQFEQVGQPTVGDETLDCPQTDCADHHNAQYGDNNRKNRNDIHLHYARFALKAGTGGYSCMILGAVVWLDPVLPLLMRKTDLARLTPTGRTFISPFEQGEIGPDLTWA